ncbi:MAG TPA: DNA double-strand break repair nuclease NurA [Bellilinea sp.]|nr:DNA double-strand break repair nuclease NurA [Bellilinea sp.]
MPVDYLHIRRKIAQYAETAPELQTTVQHRLNAALAQLMAQSRKVEELAAKVRAAAAQDKSLRTAVPVNEPLTTLRAADDAPLFATLLAADGSQINPSRHDAPPFGLVNLGIIQLQPGVAAVPQEHTSTEILLGDDALVNGSLMSEDQIALRRDIKERVELAVLAKSAPQPVLTLTDGTLDLFREPKADTRYDEQFGAYLQALAALADIGAVTAAYVDKPGSDMVTRLLELSRWDHGELWRAAEPPAFEGVRDASLFARILGGGERSAVFAVQSRSAERFAQYDPRLALNICFLNVGTTERPWIARVEFPAWVGQNAALLDQLQATLLQQCRQLGSQPFPYCLHRAHELAVVTWADKKTLQEMLASALGLPERVSNKQFHKDLPGRKRYGE